MPMSRRFAWLRSLPVRLAPVLAAAAAMAVLALGGGEAVAQRGGGGGGMGGGAGHIPMPVMGPSSGSFGRGSVNVPAGRGGPGIGRRGGNGPYARPVISGGCESARGGRGCRQPVYTGGRPFYPRPGGPVFGGRPPAVDGPIYDDAPRPVLRTRRASITPSNQRVIRSEQSTPRISQSTRRVTQTNSLRRRISSPPAGETRFVPDQVVCVLRGNLGERGIDRFVREHGLARTDNGSRRLPLLNARVFRYRITDGRSVSAVLARLRSDRRVITAQPNYLYDLAQAGGASPTPPAAAPAPADLNAPAGPVAAPASAGQNAASGSQQYAVSKLQLSKAHQIARGERVLVAVIDSGIDATHPELTGAIIKTIDVVQDGNTQPHTHGTAMAGAIAAKAQLTGVAPGAQVIAVRAFSAQGGGASSTSYQLASAVDSAVTEGARVINLSFAGPADPLLSEALKRAREKNIVLVAAAGNAGPNSPPLFPGADPSVIAVTATDENDKVYSGANRGRHIVVAAPGVDVLVPEPRGSYGLSTGTSVAAAHVSGVAALLIARNPSLDPESIRQILRRSAHSLGQTSPEDAGAGLADAFSAVSAADQRSAPGAAAGGRRR